MRVVVVGSGLGEHGQFHDLLTGNRDAPGPDGFEAPAGRLSEEADDDLRP